MVAQVSNILKPTELCTIKGVGIMLCELDLN